MASSSNGNGHSNSNNNNNALNRFSLKSTNKRNQEPMSHLNGAWINGKKTENSVAWRCLYYIPVSTYTYTYICVCMSNRFISMQVITIIKFSMYPNRMKRSVSGVLGLIFQLN